MKRYDRLSNEGLKGTISHIFAHNIRQINTLLPESGVYSGHNETFEQHKISRYLFPRSDITSMWPTEPTELPTEEFIPSSLHATRGWLWSRLWSLVAGDFLSFFLFLGGGGGGADVFSFLLCKVRESAARKLNRGQKRKQFSFRAAVTLKNHRRKDTTKNPLATQASATFVRSGSINFNLFLF